MSPSPPSPSHPGLQTEEGDDLIRIMRRGNQAEKDSRSRYSSPLPNLLALIEDGEGYRGEAIGARTSGIA